MPDADLLDSSKSTAIASLLAVAGAVLIVVSGVLMLIWTRRLQEWSSRPDRWLLARLRWTGWGIIILNGSVAGLMATQFTAVYVAAGPYWVPSDEWVASVVMFAMLLVAVLAGWVATRVGQLEQPWESAGSPAGEQFQHELRLLNRVSWGVAGCSILIILCTIPLLGVLLLFLLVWAPIPFLKLRRMKQAEILSTLAIAVQHQLPLPAELDEQARTLRGRRRQQVQDLAARLRAGESLVQALKHTRPLVSRHWLCLLEAADKGGQLPQALQMAADDQVSRHLHPGEKRGLIRCLLYFGTVGLVVLLLVGFLMYNIIPKYKAIFLGFKLDLPGSTRLIIQISDAFINYLAFLPTFAFVLLVLALSLDLQILLLLGRPLQEHWLWSQWFPRLNVPILFRGLSLAVSAQQPLLPVVATFAEAHPIPAMRSRLKQVQRQVEQGRDVWASLTQARLITQHELQSITRAQQTKTLSWTLTQLANSCGQRLRRRAELWARILQPVLVLLLSGIVGMIVWAMFEPLLTMLETVAS